MKMAELLPLKVYPFTFSFFRFLAARDDVKSKRKCVIQTFISMMDRQTNKGKTLKKFESRLRRLICSLRY